MRQVDGSTSPVLVMAEYFTDVPLVICWCQVFVPQLISVSCKTILSPVTVNISHLEMRFLDSHSVEELKSAPTG